MNGYKIFRYNAGDSELVAHGWEREMGYDFLAAIWSRWPDEVLSLLHPDGRVLLSARTAPTRIPPKPRKHDALALYAASATVVGGDESEEAYATLAIIARRAYAA